MARDLTTGIGRNHIRTSRRSAALSPLPGVVLGSRTVAGEDLVESGEGLLVQGDLQRPQRPGQLLQRPRPDDRGGDRGLVQQPGQRDVRGRLAQPVAQVLIRADLALVLLQRELGPLALAPAPRPVSLCP